MIGGITRLLITISFVDVATPRSAPPSPLPLPDSDRTIWDEISCTSALVHHPLVILGDLHVNGRIQLLASANLSVYEESPDRINEEDEYGLRRTQITIETRQLSKFANERCSHTVIAKKPGEIPTLTGDLYLPHSNLIIGANSLIVGGVIKSRGLTIDGAASVVANARLLDMDTQCDHLSGEPGLKIGHGLLHVKNGSSLQVHGGVEAPAIGCDRGGTIDIACGWINAKDSTGQIPGDVAILGSSSLTMTMGGRLTNDSAEHRTAVGGQSLVVGENSLLSVEGGNLDVDHIKVSGYSAAMIQSGSINTDLLLVTAGSTMRCFNSNSIKAKTAVIVGMGAVFGADPFAQVSGTFDSSLSLRKIQQVQIPPHKNAALKTTTYERTLEFQAGALELTDGATVSLHAASIDLAEHLSVDEWSRIRVRGDVFVGEWVSISNMSRAVFEDNIEVSTSMQIKFGAEVEVAHAVISCSLVLAGGSKLEGKEITLRQLTDKDDLRFGELEECQPMTPAMLVSKHSSTDITQASINGTIFINNRSVFKAGSLTQTDGGVIAKKESRFLVQGGPYPKTKFLDTSGQSNSTIQLTTAPIYIEGVRVENSSETTIIAPRLYLDWVDVHSKSHLIADVDEMFVRQEVVVEEVSGVDLIGATNIEGAFLSAVKSNSQIGSKCNEKVRVEVIQLRDASRVTIQSTFGRASRPELELLSGSHVELQCAVRDGLAFLNKSTDSTYKAHATWQTLGKDISMAVPPSESMSIKYLTPKTVVDGFSSNGPGGNTSPSAQSESQRKTKATGWKTIEKLFNSTTSVEAEIAVPAVIDDPLDNSSPIRKTTAKEKRRRKED